MSLFRNHRHSHQSTLGSSDSSTSKMSVDRDMRPVSYTPPSKESSFRRRLTSLVGLKRSKSTQASNAGASDFPYGYYDRSESPSPTPSLSDIRMPTGLGRRASVIERETQQKAEEAKVQRVKRKARPRTATGSVGGADSLPSPRQSFATGEAFSPRTSQSFRLDAHSPRTSQAFGPMDSFSPRTSQAFGGFDSFSPRSSQAFGGVDSFSPRSSQFVAIIDPAPSLGVLGFADALALADDDVADKKPPISRVPVELLGVLFSHASRPDLAALALVCRSFLLPAVRQLYTNLDLWDASWDRVCACVEVLASKRSTAGYVRAFACRALPSACDPATALDTVTFAIAFTNMYQLAALTIPRFEAPLFAHAAFRLRRLTVLAGALAPEELQELARWLGIQSSITSLALPHLILKTLSENALPDALYADAPKHALVLPRLAKYVGPIALAPAFVRGRPVRDATLHVHSTLYDGLKPSAIMAALRDAQGPIRHLCLAPASAKVDARTLERILKSAGAELGEDLEVLEVEWVLEDEILYKQVLSVLPRFRSLHTLRLHRRSPPPPPSSPPPSSPPPTLPLPSLSPLSMYTSPYPSPYPSPLSSPLFTEPGRPNSMSLDIPLPRAHERTHLTAWARQCPALRSVVFLSEAEWRVSMRDVQDPLSMFTFVGFVTT